MVRWRRPARSTLLFTGYSSRRVQSPSSKSNDTLSGISSIEPSKHSGSSHSLASVRSQGRMCVCVRGGAGGGGGATRTFLDSALREMRERPLSFLHTLIHESGLLCG